MTPIPDSPDNHSIKRIAKEISKPFYMKWDFWITVALEMIVIYLAIYYGNIQAQPIIAEQQASYNRLLTQCKNENGTTKLYMHDGSYRTCRDLFPDKF